MADIQDRYRMPQETSGALELVVLRNLLPLAKI